MTFVPDLTNFVVRDDQRGYLLRHTTDGSGGRVGRVLFGPGFECKFNEYNRPRPANSEELAVRPNVNETIVHEISGASCIIPGMNLRETYELLAEALLSERFNEFHDMANHVVTFQIEGGR